MGVLSELGPMCTKTPQAFRGVLAQLPGGVTEATVALLISCLAEKTGGANAQGTLTAVPSDATDAALSTLLVNALLQSSQQQAQGAQAMTGNTNWDLDNVGRVLQEDCQDLNWVAVAQAFDHPGFLVTTQPQIAALCKLYRQGSGAQHLPLQALFGSTWRNPVGQVSLLASLITAPAQVHTFPLTPAEATDYAIGNPPGNKSWGVVALTSHLLALSDHPPCHAPVRHVFAKGLMTCPEGIMLSLVKINQPPLSALKLRGEMMGQLLSLFFKPGRSAYSGAVIKRLWELSSKVVVSGCAEAFRTVAALPPGSEDWMVTVLHNVGIIRLLGGDEAALRILTGTDVEYILSVSFIASDKDVIKLDQFLKEKLTSDGMSFAFPLIAFIGKNYMIASSRSENGAISIENIAISLKALQNCDKNLLSQPVPNNNAPLSTSLKALADVCVAKHPILAQLTAALPSAPSTQGAAPAASSSSSDEIEEMANSYFQKIYTSEQSIGEVIEMLKRFKVSENSREQDVFACMIHNLFDEYRFFHKYPDKELRITGILFGTLVQHQLVSSITLGIALRYVLEALRKAPVPGGSGKMFRFGMYALEQFKARLHEWPQYCSHIIQIPHLKQSHAQLVLEIEQAMQKAKAEADRNGTAATPSTTADAKAPQLNVGDSSITPKQLSPLSNMNLGESAVPTALDAASSESTSPSAPSRSTATFGVNLGKAVDGTGLDVEHATPPDNILDRVQFIINNISMNNLDGKVSELREVMSPKWFGWLGNYLVVKRISTQPNFHALYLAFLDKLGDYGKGLVDAILASVYLNVGKLLRSQKITVLTSERSLLKNLGSWLGSITLARNKPILQRMLDCKELLFQGYETGRLIAVTPFVAKILEGAKSSVVFRPPNPWLMGLLSVFKALYDVEDLKMNIKFEVEVLCKNLNVKLDEIDKRDDLNSRVSPNKEKNPDFNTKSASTPAPSSAPAAADKGEMAPEQTVIPNLAAYVQINPSLALFNANPNLKRVVPVAVDRAIREIIQPVVERSVTIACLTTKELIVKDFAMESDENKMRKAAQLMVSNLSGSLALVTCKEPLRVSVGTNLRNLLQSALAGAGITIGAGEEQMIEQVVQVCANDNLELGCMLIEKAATEKALRDIDEALAGALQTRRKHREQTGQPYFDMSIFNNGNRYPGALPAELRPKPGGLGPQQLLVYEAFQRIPRQPVVAGAAPSAVPGSEQSSSAPQQATPQQSAQQQQGGQMESLSALASKLSVSVNNLLLAAGNRSGEVTYSILPENHEVRALVAEVRKVAGSCSDDVCLSFAQTVFKQMYELNLNEPLRLESLIAVLESIAQSCAKLSADVTTWITYAPMNTENERKLHRTILLLLVRSQLVKIGELDLFIARSMDSGRNGVWVEFALHFARTAVHERITGPSDIPNVIDSFTKIAQKQGNYKKSANKLLEELRSKGVEGGASQNSEEGGAAGGSDAGPEGSEAAKPPQQQVVDGSEGMGVSDVAAKAAEALALAARNDPPQTRQSVTHLLDYWIRVYNESPGNEKVYAQFLSLLQQHGVGKTEENSERFFRASTELVIEAVLKSGQQGQVDETGVPVLHYSVVDAYSKLVALLVKYMHGGGGADKVAAQRISLLNKVLGITVRCLMAKSATAGTFDQRPYFRLLMNLIHDLNMPDPQLDSISLQILGVFGSALHVIQPCVVPAFTFAWLELVSHRMFLPNLLLAKDQKGFALAHQLLLDLFIFLEPYLKKGELDDSIRTLYKGTLRVLLVLLHDFPEFLCEYHSSFVSVVPVNCVQLRNIFLSAFPRNMTLHDPFSVGLKIDLLPEIQIPPRILSPLGALGGIRADVDVYLKQRGPPAFLNDLLPRLLNRSGEVQPGIANSLVVYLGMQASMVSGSRNEVENRRAYNFFISLTHLNLPQQQRHQQPLMHTPEMDILMALMKFDDKNRYLILNAIANQLRYPNTHSHFYSCVMLFMFGESKSDAIKEQITRVLLERLIVHRPHPWSLLITFIELIKNPRYSFWTHSFTRCAAEIERVFESVSRSCMSNADSGGGRGGINGMVSGGLVGGAEGVKL
jgi:CCR4-NOT transcription complex subunit 1